MQVLAASVHEQEVLEEAIGSLHIRILKEPNSMPLPRRQVSGRSLAG
jgi:hypothetical protein